jgi:preprotein translocase subunit SecA
VPGQLASGQQNGGGRAATPAAAGARGTGAAIASAGSASGTSGTRLMGAGAGSARAAGAGAGGNGATPGAQARPGYTPTGEKIGRNDPCWCGSGLKYKKCHGR